MIKALRFLVLTLSVAFAANAAAEVIFYDLEDFRGAMVRVDRPVDDFYNSGLNDRASSVSIRSGSWEICSDAHFRGQCVTLGPGEYRSLTVYGLNNRVSSARLVAGPPGPGPVARGRIELFSDPNFNGSRVTLDGEVVNFEQIRFNDAARSAIVEGGSWQLCEHASFAGTCTTLEPGRYPDLGAMSGRISSARLVANRPVVTGAPPPARPEGGRAVLYAQPGLAGRGVMIDRAIVRDLREYNFNDRAASLRVESGYWMFCSDANFEGECRTFGPGDYPRLPPGLQDRISSARRISHEYPYNERPRW